MEDMDLSEDVDLEEILFLLEDNVLVRWRIEYNFFNQSIYGRLFERGNRGMDHRNMKLPEIKGAPNTAKLLVPSSTYRPCVSLTNHITLPSRKRDSFRRSVQPPHRLPSL